MEETESVLDALLEVDDEVAETLYDDDDVEMLDAEALDDSAADRGDAVPETAPPGEIQTTTTAKKKRKGKKRRRRSGSAPNYTDINRFVINTCRHLKEKKSYLVWNAVGCLGVTAVGELVKEVDTIQSCGGQKTNDGKRYRTAGGILWNILKTREPNAYKEIMEKGREFEKKLRQPKKQKTIKEDEGSISRSSTPESRRPVGEIWEGSEPMPKKEGTEKDKPESTKSIPERVSALERIRVPVSYGDLFEEGEIHD